MKKRTMKAWFLILFILGLIIGFLIPWDVRDTVKKNNFQSGVINVATKFGQLDTNQGNLSFSVVANSDDLSVLLARLNGIEPLHTHPIQNHIIYIYRGKVKAYIGGTPYDLTQGNLVFIPANTPHSLEKIGDMPAEAIVIAQPPTNEQDTVYIRK